jgi:O-antigen ligase
LIQLNHWIAKIVYNKKIIRTTFIILFATQMVLGIVNTFSTMLPIPPRTSIGGMTIIAMALIGLTWWMYKQNLYPFHKAVHPVDYLLITYVCIQAISLLVAPMIYQSTSFRILLLAAVQYGITRLVTFSAKEKKSLCIILGATAVLISLASVFQVVFRDTAITLSRKFLFGDSAYGVVWELVRGRVPHVGNLTILFPFFFGSIPFIQQRTLLSRCYVAIGTTLIFFAFFVSNFRWITLCFVVCTIIMFVLLTKFQHIKIGLIVKQATILLITTMCGIYFASTTGHYNVLDRFLLKDYDRDVTMSLGRLYLYQQAIDVFITSPIVGIGIGNYSNLVEPIIGVDFQNRIGSLYSEIDKQSVSSHNEVLTILAEGGLTSLIVFIWINVQVFMHAIRQIFGTPKRHRQERIIFITFLTSLIAYCLYGLFENTSPNNMIVIFFIYAASITWSKREAIVPHFQTRKQGFKIKRRTIGW